MNEKHSNPCFTSSLIPYLFQLKEQGRWGEITGQCLKVLDFLPQDLQTRSLLAEAYLEMGFLCSAEQEYRLIWAESNKLSDTCKMRLDSFNAQEGAHELTNTLEGSPDQEEEVLTSELATPTIAELYLSQGRRAEAIAIYERMLAACPQDKAARDRLAEIQGFPPAERTEMPHKETERIIYMTAVLEDWLKRIRNASDAG